MWGGLAEIQSRVVSFTEIRPENDETKMTAISIETYRANRDNLLTQIVDALSADDSFVAGWLTGSFARSEADAISDLDLNIVVADHDSERLCARPQLVQAGTTAERLEIISRFGQPVVIHENHHNAPEGGSFTFVWYAKSALMVDWIFIPQEKAQRPAQSVLLFDKVGVRVALPNNPESLDQRIEMLTEKIAFFWMMMAVTSKHIVRQDVPQVQIFLETLQRLIAEIQRLISGDTWSYKRGSTARLCVNRDEQTTLLREFANATLNLTPQLVALGIQVPIDPLSTLDILLNLH